MATNSTKIRRLLIIGPLADRTAAAALQSAKSDTQIIAVDGGVDRVLKAGGRIDLAVGDWDSISSSRALEKARAQKAEIVTLPRDKDESDLRVAISVARLRVQKKNTVSSIEAYGFSGGRPDQILAAHFDFADAARLFAGASVIHRDARSEAHYLSAPIKNYRIDRLKRGQTLSVFSLAQISRGVSLSGVDFPLVNADLRPSSLGLSNRVNRRSVAFNLRSGCIVAILLSDLSHS